MKLKKQDVSCFKLLYNHFEFNFWRGQPSLNHIFNVGVAANQPSFQQPSSLYANLPANSTYVMGQPSQNASAPDLFWSIQPTGTYHQLADQSVASNCQMHSVDFNQLLISAAAANSQLFQSPSFPPKQSYSNANPTHSSVLSTGKFI